MKIELWRLTRDDRQLVTTARTNAEGRTEQPLLSADEMQPGQYEIVFHAGDYFSAKGTVLPKTRLLDQIPVRIGIADAGAIYHIPLLCSPWAYSIFRA